MHADPHDAIRAIHQMVCDPDNVSRVLSALEAGYGKFLNDEGSSVKPDGYAEVLAAFEAVADFSDWWSEQQRSAA